MAGLQVFRSLDIAVREGFQIYDRVRDGYLVRKMTSGGWAMAIVIMRPNAQLQELPDSAHLDWGKPPSY